MKLNNTQFYKKQQQLKISKVLLVCVYDTIVFQLTNDIIYQKFAEFGNIQKILIFEKKDVTKFFIEFKNANQAADAKYSLNNTKLCNNICKMTIYFSNFENVDLKHQTTQGIDYIQSKQIQKNYLQKFDQLINYSKQSQFNNFYHHDFLMFSFDRLGEFDCLQKLDSKLLQSQKYLYNEQDFQHHKQCIVDKSIMKQIDNLLQNQQQKQISTTKLPKIKIQTSLKSLIIALKLYNQIQIYKLYNLFSNFANIQWIINKQQHTYIKFKSIQFAAISHNYLNNIFLFGKRLTFEIPTISQNQILPSSLNFYSQYIYCKKFQDRFTPQRSITINPPSKTLHISSIKRNICRQDILKKIFSQYGLVDKICILGNNSQKNMALVKFNKIQYSLNAIASLHNKLFQGRQMKISFTKSKL